MQEGIGKSSAQNCSNKTTEHMYIVLCIVIDYRALGKVPSITASCTPEMLPEPWLQKLGS